MDGRPYRLSIRSTAKPTWATRSDIGRATRSSSTAPATTKRLGWTSGGILTRVSCTSSKRSRGQTKTQCITKPRSMTRAPTPDPGRLRGIFHGPPDKNSVNTSARITTSGSKACTMISANRCFIDRRKAEAESNEFANRTCGAGLPVDLSKVRSGSARDNLASRGRLCS